MNPAPVVISTVGTSLLTNGVDRNSTLWEVLQRTANQGEGELNREDQNDLESWKETVWHQLSEASPTPVSKMSAELNGIVSLGAHRGGAHHYLLCTDTWQGQAAGDLVKRWLERQGCELVVLTIVEGLRTSSTSEFRQGANQLLEWAATTLPALHRQYASVIFNLSGSFKAVQAYVHTLAMLHQCEVVYIFERGPELIRIPGLPLRWDQEPLRRHAAALARLAQGALLLEAELDDLPKALLEPGEEGEVTLSGWGLNAWEEAKRDLLRGDLLPQPRLVYLDSFQRDYERRRDPEERLRLQETPGQSRRPLGERRPPAAGRRRRPEVRPHQGARGAVPLPGERQPAGQLPRAGEDPGTPPFRSARLRERHSVTQGGGA